MLPSQGRFPGGKPVPTGREDKISMALNMLLREAMFGLL